MNPGIGFMRPDFVSEEIPNHDDFPSEEEDEELTGASSDPLGNPPGSRGRKAKNPYEDTEADDNPGPSLADQIEDRTPATDEELHGGEYGTSGYALSYEQRKSSERTTMLRWTIIFIIVAIIAELFGLSGVAGQAAWIAHVLFVIFLVLFIVSLVFRGGRPPTV